MAITKKLIVLFTLAFTTFNSVSAGMVVSDPTAYAYFANQIKEAQKLYSENVDQFQKSYKNASEKLKTAMETQEHVNKVRSNIEGNLKHVMGLIDEIEKMGNMIEADKAMMSDMVLADIEDVKEYRANVKQNLNELFDIESYRDTNNETNWQGDKKSESDWVTVASEQNIMRQEAVKATIVASSEAKAKMTKELDDLKELSTLANNSLTIKDTADISNTLFVKMIQNQQETIKLLANISNSISMLNYTGASKHKQTSIKEIKQDFETKNKNKPVNSDLQKELYRANYLPFADLENEFK